MHGLQYSFIFHFVVLLKCQISACRNSNCIVDDGIHYVYWLAEWKFISVELEWSSLCVITAFLTGKFQLPPCSIQCEMIVMLKFRSLLLILTRKMVAFIMIYFLDVCCADSQWSIFSSSFSGIMEAVAKHDFVATADDELSFPRGARLKVHVFCGCLRSVTHQEIVLHFNYWGEICLNHCCKYRKRYLETWLRPIYSSFHIHFVLVSGIDMWNTTCVINPLVIILVVDLKDLKDEHILMVSHDL